MMLYTFEKFSRVWKHPIEEMSHGGKARGGKWSEVNVPQEELSLKGKDLEVNNPRGEPSSVMNCPREEQA